MALKAYLAGPWFNEEQMARLEMVKKMITASGLKVFSPKDESMFKQGDNPKQILDLNVKAIKDCDCIVVITDGKDTGTIWEAGYAYAIGRPILYVWLSHQSWQKFNLMLGASGAVVMNETELAQQLTFFNSYDCFDLTKDKGGILYE